MGLFGGISWTRVRVKLTGEIGLMNNFVYLHYYLGCINRVGYEGRQGDGIKSCKKGIVAIYRHMDRGRQGETLGLG